MYIIQTTVVYCLIINLALSSTFSLSILQRYRRQANCGKKEVACKDGQCIKRWLMCDGVYHCNDKSDETSDNCSEFYCPDNAFRCAYGACIHSQSQARCNGVQECADNSDEVQCHNRPTQEGTTAATITTGTNPTQKQTPSTRKPAVSTPNTTTESSDRIGCILPRYPKNGRYNISGNPGLRPGQRINLFSQISFYCRRGSTLSTSPGEFFCSGENTWIPNNNFPECITTCSALVSKTVEIKCKLGDSVTDCTKPALPGTMATLKCHSLYEYPGGTPPFRTIVCADGSWDYSLKEYRCIPVCGRVVSKGIQTLIIGGAHAMPGDYPWQVGVYRNNPEKEHICSGSIINQKVVISAAHCFTNLNNGDLYPESRYLIAAGKYYRSYDDPRDKNTQASNIKKIYVPDRYKGLQRNYDSDLALVVLDIALKLSVFVQPVCVDWEDTLSDIALLHRTGIVTGWGFTKEGTDPSDELKELQVPYVDFNTCYNNVPSDFRQYITNDKMCAGFLDGNSVCQGDSGGPLMFRNGERYYVKGIVSVGPTKGSSCDSRQYGAYTKVSQYIEYIANIEAANRPTADSS